MPKCSLFHGIDEISLLVRYLLSHDIEMRTEACLLSANLFKCVYQESVPHSKHDYDYSKDDTDVADFLLPGLLVNSDPHRFNLRYVIAALNFVCLELLNAKHYLSVSKL